MENLIYKLKPVIKYLHKKNIKGIQCNVNNTQHKLIINIDDVYNGFIPIGPPFEDDSCIVQIDNIESEKNTSLIQRSPLIKSRILEKNNNPQTIISMLQYVDINDNNETK